jgi:hypothetical protein
MSSCTPVAGVVNIGVLTLEVFWSATTSYYVNAISWLPFGSVLLGERIEASFCQDPRGFCEAGAAVTD